MPFASNATLAIDFLLCCVFFLFCLRIVSFLWYKSELPNSKPTSELLMKPRPSLVILVIFALLICDRAFVHGPGTDLGTIRVSVTDSSGAVVAKTRVIVRDVGTGATGETTTNSCGQSQMS